MNLKRLGLVLSVSAGVALLYGACGEGGGGGDGSCTSNANCKTNEICHPVEKVCVQTCNSAADCPDTSKDCRALGTGPGGDAGTTDGGTTGQKICHCSTTQLCQGGNAGSSLVCNEETRICVVKCSNDAACGAGRKCENGQCKTVTTTEETCTKQGTCPSGKICDFSTGTCGAPATCSVTNPQPDTCKYGQYCTNGTCAEVPKPTCPQFTNSPHGSTWEAKKTGPIIISIEKESYEAAAAFCGGLNRYKVKVTAYDLAGTFPAGTCTNPGAARGSPEQAMEAKYHAVDPQGNEINPKPFVQCVNTTNGGKNTTFYVNFCSNSTSGYTAALHFVDGNEQCATISAN